MVVVPVSDRHRLDRFEVSLATAAATCRPSAEGSAAVDQAIPALCSTIVTVPITAGPDPVRLAHDMDRSSPVPVHGDARRRLSAGRQGCGSVSRAAPRDGEIGQAFHARMLPGGAGRLN